MKRIIIGLIFLSGMSAVNAQINVQHVTSTLNVDDKQGFFYALPRTGFQVDITVLKTEYFAGPYAMYAAKYLDIVDVNTSDYNSFSVENVELNLIAEPDPDHYYFVEIDEKATKEDGAAILSMSEEGFIIGLQPTSKLKKKKESGIHGNEVYEGLFKYFAETNLYQTQDTIIKKVVVDTAIIEKVYYESRMMEKSNEQKAAEAANMISKIRESRVNLLSGYQEIAYDAGSIAYMDKKLLVLEKEYMSLFTGVNVTKKLHYTYSVYPVAGDNNARLFVFSFSQATGISDVNSSGAQKYYLDIEEPKSSQQMSTIKEIIEKSDGNRRGFYYRIPAIAKVSMHINRDMQVQGIYKIAQLGTVSFLPPTTVDVEFHKKTGSIKSVVID